MLDLNQIERQEKERSTEGAIEQKRQQVCSGERSRSEERERQHWIRNSRLDHQEEAEQHGCSNECHEH